ncbi:MAG: DinB family protein [Pseudomonadota bacterium]
MITLDYARTMARYTVWQNNSLMAAADGLNDIARWQDRGAFFRSIAETLNHILGDDVTWLARLEGRQTEAERLGARFPYTDAPRDWEIYKKERQAANAALVTWAENLSDAALSTQTSWQRGAEQVETLFAFNVAHLFNHGTHHRGQVHAMLTAAGAEPEPTDLQMLLVRPQP